MRNVPATRALRASQRGSALVIILVLLVAMLILTVMTSQSNVFLERASSNSREVDVAFQAAETALRAGELAAAGLSGPSDGDADCAGGVCYLGNDSYQLTLGNWSGLTVLEAVQPSAPSSASAAVKSSWVSMMDAGGPAIPLAAGTVGGVRAQPRYLIEVLPSVKAGDDNSAIRYVFRVTAKGYGQGANSGVVVQSVYSPPST